METINLHDLLVYIQKSISFCGVLIICLGVLSALWHYLSYPFYRSHPQEGEINQIRLKLSRVLTLGLEFIVAADLIGTTTAPDYYSIGIVASIVLIRTLLSYTLNREISTISQQETQKANTYGLKA